MAKTTSHTVKKNLLQIISEATSSLSGHDLLLETARQITTNPGMQYCFNVFPITCPPLRERKEDIPLLFKHFCQKHEGKIGKKILNVTDKVIEAMMAYDWTGNIRELENIRAGNDLKPE